MQIDLSAAKIKAKMQWNDIFMCPKNTQRNKNKARENVFQK